MNLYATISDLKERLGITASTYDTILAALLQNASRVIDDLCARYFYSKSAILYFDTQNSESSLLCPDDILTLSALTTDAELDGTFDGETWVQGTDYRLRPINEFPKTTIEALDWGSYVFAKNASTYIKATGIFGYGNGASATPWESTAINGTVATTDGTTLTLSANDVIKAGHTILVESEQMYVSAVGILSATVKRGMNGTTAAAHSSKAISVAQYPDQIKQACIVFATRFYHQMGAEEFQSERIRDYSYSRFGSADLKQIDLYLIAPFRRLRCG